MIHQLPFCSPDIQRNTKEDFFLNRQIFWIQHFTLGAEILWLPLICQASERSPAPPVPPRDQSLPLLLLMVTEVVPQHTLLNKKGHNLPAVWSARKIEAHYEYLWKNPNELCHEVCFKYFFTKNHNKYMVLVLLVYISFCFGSLPVFYLKK